jgi:exodeoxyribonuclease-5
VENLVNVEDNILLNIDVSTLNESQQDGLRKTIMWWKFQPNKQYFKIFGYAGTGKSYLVNFIIKSLGLSFYDNVRFCTFTGNAAFNLIKKGNKSASTIHKLIYDCTIEEVPQYKKNPETGINEIVGYKKVIHTQKKVSLPSEVKLIVVDEASMASNELIEDLLSFKIKTIFLGDPGQLSPINGTNKYMVEPDVLLEEIMRQDDDSYIVDASFAVRNQEPLAYGIYGDKNEFAVVPALELDDEDEAEVYYNFATQIICGKNNTRKKINNLARSFKGLHGKLPVIGDKVVCTANNWVLTAWSPKLETHVPLVNGTVGYVTEIKGISRSQQVFYMSFKLDFDEGCVFDNIPVSFYNFDPAASKPVMSKNPLNKINVFDFGYAITCHKAQGNQYKNVLIIAEKICFKDDHTGIDFDEESKWLYTAITRAEKKAVIIFDSKFYMNRFYKKDNDFWDSYHEFY